MIAEGDQWLECAYIAAAMLFIYALHALGDQRSTKRGTFLGGLGMVIAVVVTVVDGDFENEGLIYVILTIAIGLIVGGVAAATIKMTGMPELVGMLNAFGGLAAALEGLGLYFYNDGKQPDLTIAEHNVQRIELVLGIIIGVITFTGSVVACLKLKGTIGGKPLNYMGRINSYFLLMLGCIVMGAFMIPGKDEANFLYALVVILFSGVLGVVFVMGIGGADMPVVISILNSLSGWSGSAAGFMMLNPLLIITGAMVGASGAILSDIMCTSMNRTIVNVLKGGFGDGAPKKKKEGPKEAGPVLEATKWDAEQCADALVEAETVYIIPGYGMAVAQCQTTIAALSTTLKDAGKRVRFAIHPVAGRLPGHMNVLLAEAKVPYTDQVELDQANDDFPNTDVAIICGSNDCVNPDAENDPDSPIAGMEVLQCWNAKRTIMMKRSLGAGYAGVGNPLFYHENNSMLLGNAKDTSSDMLTALKSKLKGKEKKASGSGDVEMEEVKKEVQLPEPEVMLGVVREMEQDETRVALSPESVLMLRKKKFGVYVESGCGGPSNFTDAMYTEAGAEVVSVQEVWSKAKVILKVRAPILGGEHDEVKYLNAGKVLISYVYPVQNPELHKALIESKAQIFAMDMVPRISRAQALDALSSMAKIAGYRAVLEAAHHYNKFYSAECTAAGSNPPAKFLVIGAGVAGLSVIGTARKFGSTVRVFDVRPATREEVESLGGEFLTVDMQEDGTGSGGYAKTMSPEFIAAEMKLFKQQCADVDVVITTALIPGRAAPKLLKMEHVEAMKPGSVIVDLAAEQGGNCEATVNDEVTIHKGVKVLGYSISRLVASMPDQASSMYGQNLVSALKEFGKTASDWNVDLKNEVVRGMLIADNGTDQYLEYKPPVSVATETAEEKQQKEEERKRLDEQKALARLKKAKIYRWVSFVILFAGLILMSIFAPMSLVDQLMVFALSCVAGPCVILGVLSSLHTPLMSLSNAISGIVVLGGIASLGDLDSGDIFTTTAGLSNVIAIVIASVNVGGGFLATYRMLDMFKA